MNHIDKKYFIQRVINLIFARDKTYQNFCIKEIRKTIEKCENALHQDGDFELRLRIKETDEFKIWD